MLPKALAAKVERGCEAGEFKESSCVLTGKNQAQWRIMKVRQSKVSFHHAALSSTVSVQSRILQYGFTA